MKTYKLKDNVTAQMLTEIGFVDNEFGNDKPVEETDQKEFTAIRTKGNVAVAIDHITYDDMKTYVDKIEVYRFIGKADDHKQISIVKNWTPYIQDLIDKVWVE